MIDTKWCESWEKNFEATLKAMNKFKDDLKSQPDLPGITSKRCYLYLELLFTELEEIKSNFKYTKAEEIES